MLLRAELSCIDSYTCRLNNLEISAPNNTPFWDIEFPENIGCMQLS